MPVGSEANRNLFVSLKKIHSWVERQVLWNKTDA